MSRNAERDPACSGCGRRIERDGAIHFVVRRGERRAVVALCAGCALDPDGYTASMQCSGCLRHLYNYSGSRERDWCSEACRARARDRRRRAPRSATTSCARCGADLGDDRRGDAVYCSPACRQAAYRERHREVDT